MPDKDDPLGATRARAYELADSGRHGDWASLSAELAQEGAPEGLVRRLTYDGLFQIMLKNRMSAARGG
jgi:hypothetical protein